MIPPIIPRPIRLLNGRRMSEPAKYTAWVKARGLQIVWTLRTLRAERDRLAGKLATLHPQP